MAKKKNSRVARILFCADLHIFSDRVIFPSTYRCLQYLVKYAIDVKPDAVIFGGDFWDREIYLSHRVEKPAESGVCGINNNRESESIVSLCCKAVKDIVPSGAWVYFIYGTPYHERPGSLSIFERLHSRIRVFDKPELVELQPSGEDEPVRILFVPSEQPLSLPEVQKLLRRKPDVLVAHGAVTEMEASVNQQVRGGHYDIEELKKCAPLCILGHIHARTEIDGRILYPGSMNRIALSDVDTPLKGFYDILTTDPPEVKFVPTPAREIVLLELSSNKFVKDNSISDKAIRDAVSDVLSEKKPPGLAPDGLPVRYDLHIRLFLMEEHREFVRDIIARVIKNVRSMYSYFGHISIERKIVSPERNVEVKREAALSVSRAVTVEDKVKAYLSAVGKEKEIEKGVIERLKMLVEKPDLSADELMPSV